VTESIHSDDVNRIVVIGASAGGPNTLSTVLGALDPHFPAAVMVVLHLSPESPGYLVPMLQNSTKLAIHSARDQRIEAGHIYVAPPDRHLVVERGRITTTLGPKENRFRPSIDVTFRTAAFAYRQAVVGVVLTGLLDDGTAGLFYVKRHEGITVVQDPDDARFPSMPEHALAHVQVDHVVTAAEIGPLLSRLVRQPKEAKPMSILPKQKIRRIFARREGSGPSENSILDEDEESATPAGYTCPDCAGSLFEIQNRELLRFRCRTGHAYALESLVQNQKTKVEETLFSAEAALMEEIELLQLAAAQARAVGKDEQAAQIENTAEQAKARVGDLERMLLSQ
jgi:two-component system, chemotaxis family, protein-glutamate methylesterase/glutaminase